MDITIIAETQDGGLHPVTAQLVGAASSLGASLTVICPGGAGGEGSEERRVGKEGRSRWSPEH